MKSSHKKYTIAVVGLWHLGEVFSAGLAHLGHTVTAISDDAAVISGFQKNQPPLPEPGLVDLIRAGKKTKRISYTTDFSAVRTCNVVWVTFDTKVDDRDNIDTAPIFDAVEKLIPALQKDTLVVVSSQIPVGTSQKIIDLVARRRPDLRFDYAYTPENLRLGEAVKSFLDPARVIVGAASLRAAKKMKEIFSNLPAEVIFMSPASAEMGKHALNAFLATSISFANDLSDIAEKVGADMRDVSRVLHSDPRIGPRAYLDAGLSFSGGTLGRDINILRALAKKFAITPSLMEAIYQKNEGRKQLVMGRLRDVFGKKLTGLTVAIFGLTYKPGTTTLRRSHALEVADDLVRQGANVFLHDPQADEKEIRLAGARFFSDPYRAVHDADAIVVMTPWEDFRKLDFSRLAKKARPAALFFDPTNFFSKQEATVTGAGFRYLGIGRPFSTQQ